MLTAHALFQAGRGRRLQAVPFRYGSVRIVLGGEVIEGRGGRCRRVDGGQRRRTDREQPRGRKILALAGRPDQRLHQPVARGRGLPRVPAELEILLGQLRQMASLPVGSAHAAFREIRRPRHPRSRLDFPSTRPLIDYRNCDVHYAARLGVAASAMRTRRRCHWSL